MNHISALYLLPIIAAFIGWLTNYLAVKMLFRPRTVRKIFGLKFQGVFPKRQKDLARRIAEIISTEFLATADLEQSFSQYLHSKELRAEIETHLRNFIKTKVKDLIPILPGSYLDTLAGKLSYIYQTDLDALLENVAYRIVHSDAVPDIRALIEERISEFPPEKLENLCKAVLRKEFRFIEIIGGVLGFIVGVIQMFIAYFAL